MANHEERRAYTPFVHVLLAFNKSAREERANPPVMRKVITKSLDDTLLVFRAQLQALGDEWRIHHTVNARDVEKARKYLMKKLIDHPELCSNLETEWRTALLQSDCIYGPKRFMLDIDTKDRTRLAYVDSLITEELEKADKELVVDKYESPKGWHYLMSPFDTRTVCELDYVTLLRDGYYYLETVK